MKAVFLDTETDGLDPDVNTALEIAVCIYDLHTMTCIDEYSSFIRCSERQWCFGTSEAHKVNGILWDDVKDAKESSEVCDDLCELFVTHEIDKINSVFICQNPYIDRSFFPQIMSLETQQELELPYHWLDLATMYWMKMLTPKNIKGRTLTYYPAIGVVPLSKDAIANALGIHPEKKPHRAMNGVKHLIACYKALLEI